MGFLDKMLKDVEKGVGRAQFEADKLLKVNALKSELEKMKREQQNILAEVGKQALALQEAGAIALPGLETQIAQLQELRTTLAGKELELETMQKGTYEETLQAAKGETQAAAAGSTDAPASAEASAKPTGACPHCGESAPAGATFCPECGGKLT